MAEVEAHSWWFVNKEWGKLKRMPTADEGFEEKFREYLYKKIPFDVVSDVRDMKLGLSYSTLSDNPHELDIICVKARNLFIFELKHYKASDITKEIVFTFLGKVELIDLDSGESMRVRYVEPKGETIAQDKFSIHYESVEYQVGVEVKKANKDLLQEGEQGLLTVDEDNAVLDLTLMGFEDRPAARTLFGEVRIHGFKGLYKKDETVILDTREGLDYTHPFNAILKKEVVRILRKIIEEEEKRAKFEDIKLDKKLDNRITLRFPR